MVVVCLSVCPVSDPKSRLEGRSKLKIDGQEDHDTGDLWPHLEVEGSKVKVTRPHNVVTDVRHIFGKGQQTNFKLGKQIEYDDPHYRHAQWRQMSKVKIIRSSRQSDARLLITRQRKVAATPKLGRRLSVPRLRFRRSSKVKRWKVKVTRPLWALAGAGSYCGGRSTTYHTACCGRIPASRGCGYRPIVWVQ